jgi:hypothetical protein
VITHLPGLSSLPQPNRHEKNTLVFIVFPDPHVCLGAAQVACGHGLFLFFYTACYFGLGWSRKWTGLAAWKHHLIALVPLVYLSGSLLVEAYEMFFPIFTPLLFLVGLFGYLAG